MRARNGSKAGEVSTNRTSSDQATFNDEFVHDGLFEMAGVYLFHIQLNASSP